MPPTAAQPGSTHYSNLLLQPCSSRYVFMRPQIGQEKIWLLCFLLSPGTSLDPPTVQPGHSTYRKERNKWGPQHLPETDALASLAGACGQGEAGQTDRWIWLCMEQTPLPSPFFELLVTVLAAEAPAFSGSI